MRRACPENNQGTCPWGHNQDKAADIQSNPELLNMPENSKIQAQGKKNWPRKRHRQTGLQTTRVEARGLTLATAVVAGIVVARKEAAAGARRPQQPVRPVRRSTRMTAVTAPAHNHQTVVLRMHPLVSNSRRQPDMPVQAYFAFPTAAMVLNGLQYRWPLKGLRVRLGTK